jgi:hypothetical protein
MEAELMITISQNGYNIYHFIRYIWRTGMVILFGIFITKIILQMLDYLTKQKKQIELNSAVINTLIENNDHKNLKFEETVNELKQHILENNSDIYNDIVNIKRQFNIETEKISNCISNIKLINNNIIKSTSNQTKINILVEKINKYFEFFHELDLKKGETYKKKMYFEFNRMEYSTVKDLQLHNGFNWFYQVDPYEITPLLMKYFEKFYDKTIDKFYPLQFSVFSSEATGNSLDWYESEQQRQSQMFGNEFKKCNTIQNIKALLGNCSMTHIAFMNRNSVRLLDETDEEFEFKILQYILYELQDKYVIYKQIDFYTKPLEK